LSRKKEKISPETTASSVSAGYIAWAALILIMVFAGLVRYRLLAVPLERDEGEYAYAGQLILQGVPPYQEVYNMKLPGIYAAYAVILAVFGQTHQSIHTGLLIINEITIVLVFLLAKRLLNLSAAVVSAVAFAVFSLGAGVYGVSANAEHFVILFAVAGLLVMLRALDKNSLWSFFAAGVLLGISFTMKQHGLAFSAVAMLCLFLEAVFQKPILCRKLIKMELFLAAGIVAVVTCLCLVMVWAGVFKSFWFWTVDYARTYISRRSFHAGYKDFIVNSSFILNSSRLLWVMSGLGIICLAAGQITKSKKTFLSLYAVFSFLSICPGLYFRPHYFILLLPVAALLAGTAVHVLSAWLSRLAAPCRCIPLLLAAICVGQSLYRQRDFLFRITPNEACRAMYGYGVNPFVESIEIASFIHSHTTPQDTIAILGSEPQICFYAHRRSASGYIYMYPLMEKNPFALQMQKDFIRETEAMSPKFLVFMSIPYSWLRCSTSPNLIFEWMDQYCSDHFNLVGTAELMEHTAICHWGEQVKWPDSSKQCVCIFERKKDQPKQNN
jgi:hypothetical protein